ncbi:type II and III secretion system protein family protein [Azospira restricta]|uniref:Type II and III secretion system protein family protein n=1 Tax=Azospira restricta TaxID=404405 RepID=A0A974SMB7_9RHOO|nr:type II and III secretion system protein family protein [Azospira restricta]QRJ62921.1 type II and III secretion system protein family protein [Azospira restricta]
MDYRIHSMICGMALASLAVAQPAVEYGAVGARQGAVAAGAGTAVAPATGSVAAVDPGTARRRAAGGEGATSRADGPNCVGEMAAPTMVGLAVGKSTLLKMPEPVVKRTVGDPGVVETRLVSPQMLYVLGIETGSTNMILQGKSGRCEVVDVQVGLDAQGVEAKVRELFPDEKEVKVRVAANSLVLTGTASDAMVVNQIVQVAGAYVRTGQGASGGGAAGSTAVSPRIVNMMSVAAPQQVMLEVKIAEVSKALIEKLGAELNIVKDNGSWTYSLLSSFLFSPAAGGGIGVAHKLSNLNIEAEDSEELVKILAEPTVMAISGQEGSFLAGGRIFIPVAQNAATGTGTTITLEEKEFGVGLRFTPTVLSGDRINLRVAPEVSEVNPEGIGVTVNGSQTLLPSITTRRAATTIQLKDGQTFAIGGLVSNNVRHSIKAYPFLGEIPVLGALFRSNNFQNNRTELLFVVTPRLVKPLPPGYALPTDAYVPPGRAGRLANGRMEGAPERSEDAMPAPEASTAGQGKPAGGFEVK